MEILLIAVAITLIVLTFTVFSIRSHWKSKYEYEANQRYLDRLALKKMQDEKYKSSALNGAVAGIKQGASQSRSKPVSSSYTGSSSRSNYGSTNSYAQDLVDLVLPMLLLNDSLNHSNDQASSTPADTSSHSSCSAKSSCASASSCSSPSSCSSGSSCGGGGGD